MDHHPETTGAYYADKSHGSKESRNNVFPSWACGWKPGKGNESHSYVFNGGPGARLSSSWPSQGPLKNSFRFQSNFSSCVVGGKLSWENPPLKLASPPNKAKNDSPKSICFTVFSSPKTLPSLPNPNCQVLLGEQRNTRLKELWLDLMLSLKIELRRGTMSQKGKRVATLPRPLD